MLRKAINQIHNLWFIIALLRITAWHAFHIWAKGNALRQNPFTADAVLVRWAEAIMQAVDAKITIHNPHQTDLTPTVPTIIMVNHASLLDIPVSYCVFRKRLRMIGKKELARIPVFGKAIYYARHMFVDRNNPRQAVKDLQIAKQAIQDGILLWIAPEGTRSADGQLQPLKRGGFKLAMQSGAQIIPVTLCGTHALLAKKSIQLKRHGLIDVHVGKPIFPHEGIDCAALMQSVHQAIEAPLIDKPLAQ